MPRKYRPKVGARRCGSCDSSKLEEALNKVAAGETEYLRSTLHTKKHPTKQS